MGNPKTTIMGILTIIAAVLNAAMGVLGGKAVDWTATATAIFAGIGLIAGKDGGT